MGRNGVTVTSTWQKAIGGEGERGMAADGVATDIGEGGSGSPEFGMPAALSPSAGGEVVDGAREVSPRPSVVTKVTRKGCGGGGSSPEEWRRCCAANMALEAVILSTTCVCACVVTW